MEQPAEAGSSKETTPETETETHPQQQEAPIQQSSQAETQNDSTENTPDDTQLVLAQLKDLEGKYTTTSQNPLMTKLENIYYQLVGNHVDPSVLPYTIPTYEDGGIIYTDQYDPLTSDPDHMVHVGDLDISYLELADGTEPYLHVEAAGKLAQLVKIAESQGYNIVVAQAYRSYEQQQAMYTGEVGVAGGGRSQHQSGMAVDLYVQLPNGELGGFPSELLDEAVELGFVRPISWDTPHFFYVDYIRPGLAQDVMSNPEIADLASNPDVCPNGYYDIVVNLQIAAYQTATNGVSLADVSSPTSQMSMLGGFLSSGIFASIAQFFSDRSSQIKQFLQKFRKRSTPTTPPNPPKSKHPDYSLIGGNKRKARNITPGKSGNDLTLGGRVNPEGSRNITQHLLEATSREGINLFANGDVVVLPIRSAKGAIQNRVFTIQDGDLVELSRGQEVTIEGTTYQVSNSGKSFTLRPVETEPEIEILEVEELETTKPAEPSQPETSPSQTQPSTTLQQQTNVIAAIGHFFANLAHILTPTATTIVHPISNTTLLRNKGVVQQDPSQEQATCTDNGDVCDPLSCQYNLAACRQLQREQKQAERQTKKEQRQTNRQENLVVKKVKQTTTKWNKVGTTMVVIIYFVLIPSGISYIIYMLNPTFHNFIDNTFQKIKNLYWRISGKERQELLQNYCDHIKSMDSPYELCMEAYKDLNYQEVTELFDKLIAREITSFCNHSHIENPPSSATKLRKLSLFSIHR